MLQEINVNMEYNRFRQYFSLIFKDLRHHLLLVYYLTIVILHWIGHLIPRFSETHASELNFHFVQGRVIRVALGVPKKCSVTAHWEYQIPPPSFKQKHVYLQHNTTSLETKVQIELSKGGETKSPPWDYTQDRQNRESSWLKEKNMGNMKTIPGIYMCDYYAPQPWTPPTLWWRSRCLSCLPPSACSLQMDIVWLWMLWTTTRQVDEQTNMFFCLFS